MVLTFTDFMLSPVVLEQFVKEGGNIDHHLHDGDTLLILAVKKGMKDSVKTLLSLGADVNKSVGADLYNPLEAALMHNMGAEIIEMLLRAGARPNSEMATSPLRMAIQRGNLAVVDVMVRYGAKIDHGVLRAAMAAKANEVLRFLLKKGANPNERPMGQWDLMHYCVNAEQVRILLRYGYKGEYAPSWHDVVAPIRRKEQLCRVFPSHVVREVLSYSQIE